MDEKNTKLFNIDILSPSAKDVKYLGQIMKLNIFGQGNDFEEEGLFSTTIFGPVGSKERNSRFGYIDLGVPLLHPLVYSHICGLNSLYKEILHGETRAVFNEEKGDFERVSGDSLGVGGTGLYFFIDHISKLKLEKGKSDQRDSHIELIEKYSSGEHLIQYLLVLPAGFRDYIVKGGKPSEDEINDKYRSVLSIASTLVNMKIQKRDIELYNPTIISIQKIFLDIYLHFKNILSDKTGFLQDSFAKRAVMYGTRNVITPATNLTSDLDSENAVGFNDTITGLKQFVNGIKPITKNKIKTIFVDRVINTDNNSAYLFDPKTFEIANSVITSKTMKMWTTFEGLDKVISKLNQDEIRNTPVLIDGLALAMVRDTGNKIELFFPDKEIENKKGLRPITYFELLYLAVYDVRSTYPAMLTRYPVTGVGSTYLTNIHLKSTVIDREIELVLDGVSKHVYNYPILKEKAYNALSPHYTRLGRLGADHDGDMVTLNFLMLNEVLEERNKIFDSIDYYIDTNGNLTYSTAIHPAVLVMKHLTDTLDKDSVEIQTFKERGDDVGKGKLIAEISDININAGGDKITLSKLDKWLIDSKIVVVVHKETVTGFVRYNIIDKPEHIVSKYDKCLHILNMAYSDNGEEVLEFITDGIHSNYPILHKPIEGYMNTFKKLGFSETVSEEDDKDYLILKRQ